ncbi:MAG: hypothetical protein DHS20C11_05310 [Lysobacteraceae bacterium]|nr:MAG: hypothetical protein DHS20C11_05310 [Xanthomonadaceae bacterium]
MSFSVVSAPVIDTFETDQLTMGEIGTVAGAIDVVRFMDDNGSMVGFGTPMVSGGQFQCAAGTIFGDLAQCRLVYDGINNGAGDINTGVLGTGMLGGGIDFVDSGNTKLTIMVTGFLGPTGSITLNTRDYAGDACITSATVTSVGEVELPFSGGSCTMAPDDVRGFQITVTATGTVGSFMNIDMPEATPVELLQFGVD